MRLALAGSVLAAACCLAGCADAPVPTAAPPTATTAPASTTPARTTTPVPTTAAITAADGTDVSACVDGTCEVLVTDSTEIPLPRDAGVSLRVRKQSASTFVISSTRTDGSGGETTLSEGGFAQESLVGAGRFTYTGVPGGVIVRVQPA